MLSMTKDQRRIEFEVGYALEGVLPDMTCRRIQEGLMVPYFKKVIITPECSGMSRFLLGNCSDILKV